MDSAAPASRRSLIENLEGRTLFSTPNDPLFNDDGRFTNVNAEKAWDITTGSANVVVAVIDSGMDTAHPDLAANVYVNPGEIPGDGIDNDNNGYIDDVNGWDFVNNDNVTEDSIGHGTHVSGIIGAVGNNGVGTTGIMQTVRLLPIKIGGETNEVFFDAAIEGLHYLAAMKRLYVSSGGTEGANVVVANGSFGGLDFPYNRKFDRAIKDAADAGILFVVAAGNDSANNDPAQDFPAKFTLSRNSVIAVAATDRNDALADFTNIGKTSVNVAAPGVDIVSTWPTALTSTLQNGYETLSGTSMASPMVTGLVGLMAAANPNATPQQLKEALFQGVDVIPSLDKAHDQPVVVSTGGRVDAFKALRGIVNYEAKTDTATQGAWQNIYGTEGHVLPLDTPVMPGATQFSITGAQVVTVGVKPGDPSVLQPVNGVDDVAGYYSSTGNIDINLNIPDTLTHRVSLYFSQFDKSKRTERIEVFDAATGEKLNENTVSNFAAGTYVTYDITGAVVIRVSGVSGKDVVLSGIFIDPNTFGPSVFLNEDSITSGNWMKQYDAAGAVLFGRTNFPTDVTATVTGGDTGIYAASTKQKGALLLPGSTKLGSIGFLKTATTATVGMSFSDGLVHQISVYALDFDKQSRVERIEVLDSNGNVLDQREIAGFETGKYLTWQVTGDVTIRVTKISGPDAVISGIFIDQPIDYTGHYSGLDTTTQGSWKGTYGLDAQYIVGYREGKFLPAGLEVIDDNELRTVLDTSSNSKPAVQKDDAQDRIKATMSTRNSMTLTLSLGDSDTRKVSFYAADYGNKKRQQTIEVFDDNGNLIASTDMTAFAGGQYANFDLSGNLTVRITNNVGNANNAVLSAIFFD